MSQPWEDFSPGGTTTTTVGPWQDFKQEKGQSVSGPWDDFKGDAQNMGKTSKGTVFGEVTKGREPGVEEMGVTGLGGEAVRRTLNLPFNLMGQQDEFRPGDSLLPAEGVKQLLDKYVVFPGELQLGHKPEEMEKALYERFGVSPSPNTQGIQDAIQGVKQGVSQGVSQLATPENAFIAATIAAAPMAGLEKLAAEKAALAYFFPQIVGEALPESAGKTSAVLQDANATPMQKGSAVGETAALGLMGLGLGNDALASAYAHRIPDPTILRPEEFPTPSTATMDEVAGRIPPERQIPAPLERGNPNPIPPVGPINVGPTMLPQTLENVNKQFNREPIPTPAGPPGLLPGEDEPMLPEQYKISPAWQRTRRQGGRFYKPPEEPPTESKMYSGLGDAGAYDDLVSRFREFIKAGDFPKAQAIQQQIEDLKNNQSARGFTPGSQIKSEDLRPAIKVEGRILVGEYGDTHADVLQRNGIDPSTIPHSDIRRGFVDVNNPNELIARQDAANRSGLKGTADAGGLDSMDLPGAAMKKLERESEQPNAIRELRPDRVSETQPPGDISKVEEEIRPGANAKGEARETSGQQIEREGYEAYQKARVEKRPYTEEEKAKLLRQGQQILSDHPEVTEGAEERGNLTLEQQARLEKARQKFKYKRMEGFYGKDEFPGDEPTKYLSGIDPEDIKKLAKAGKAFATAKIHENAPESVPKFVYRITKNGQAEEITDQYELGRAITALGDKHYWINSNGKLIKGNGADTTHYLIAKKTLGEKVTDPFVSGEDSDLRSTYAKMRGNGYARMMEQEDGVFVRGKANEAQIQSAKALARETQKPLYHDDKKLYDPHAEGSGGSTYYSGVPIVDTVKKMVDHIFGTSVNRHVDETMKYYAGRAAGKTLPHTSAASEEVANKLIRAASADVALGVAKAGPVVITQYKKRVASELYNAYVKSGLGQPWRKGTTAPATMARAEIGRKPIWVRKDLIPELNRVFNDKQRVNDPSLFHYMLDLATDVQLVGPTDLMFHTANMIASMSYSLGKGSDLNDVLLNLPGIGTIDAILRVAKERQRLILNDPQVQRELVGLAKIGSLRGIDPQPGTGIWNWSNRFIQAVDRAGRLARNKMFDDLVSRKLVENTEEGRREFVNKMGQYNDKLMGQFQSTFRKSFSPFVVAGRTFNRNAMENLLMSNPAKELNPQAYWKMKALNLINLTTAAIAVPIAANLAITGTPWGRPGTDPGSIDLGPKFDEANGRHRSLDLLQLNLVRRALRISGAQAVYRGLDKGESLSDITDDAARDILEGVSHPWLGPPARAALTLATGQATPGGYTVAEDPSSFKSRAKAALQQVNPIVAGWAEGMAQSTGEGTDKIIKDPLLHLAQRYGSILGLKEGKFPTHEQLLEKEQGEPVDKMDIGERIVAEEEHKDKVDTERKMKPPGVRMAEEIKAGQKAEKNIIKRGSELQDSLDKPDRQWLESRSLILRGFDNKVTLGKQKVYLTENEMARYTDLVKENVSDAISVFREKYDDMPSEKTKKLFYSKVMTAAREVAKKQLEGEMVGKNVPKKKRKRFSIFRQEPEEGESEE